MTVDAIRAWWKARQSKRQATEQWQPFGSIRGESAAQRAERLLLEVLPRIESRDDAVSYVALVYPTANVENLRYAIAGALFLITEEPVRQKDDLEDLAKAVATVIRENRYGCATDLFRKVQK